MAAPTSVTKMTGFLSNQSGLSFLHESTTACAIIRWSKRGSALTAKIFYSFESFKSFNSLYSFHSFYSFESFKSFDSFNFLYSFHTFSSSIEHFNRARLIPSLGNARQRDQVREQVER
jgi:hypothetical protein